MFKLLGAIRHPSNPAWFKAVLLECASSAIAHQTLAGLKDRGYTAEFTATVTTGAGSVTYKIIVE